jgi:hypothetical protein
MTDNSKSFNLVDGAGAHLNFDWGGLASSALGSGATVFGGIQQTKAANATAAASQAASQAAIEVEKLRLEQARLMANGQAPGGGMSTGAIIGLTAGGIAIVGLVVFLAVRKK